MPSTRIRSAVPGALVSPSMISPSEKVRDTTGRSPSSTTAPTQSRRYTVWPVVGRTWPRTTKPRPSLPRTGANSSRSAKQKSASIPQLATSRCR